MTCCDLLQEGKQVEKGQERDQMVINLSKKGLCLCWSECRDMFDFEIGVFIRVNVLKMETRVLSVRRHGSCAKVLLVLAQLLIDVKFADFERGQIVA